MSFSLLAQKLAFYFGQNKLLAYSNALFQLQVNQFNLTNLRPGTRYKLKLAAKVMKNTVIKRGMYSKWVNARTRRGKGNAFLNKLNLSSLKSVVVSLRTRRKPGHALLSSAIGILEK